MAPYKVLRHPSGEPLS